MKVRDINGQWSKGGVKHPNWYALSGDKHPRKIIVEEELLWSLYYGNMYTKGEIADIVGCSRNTIYKLMDEYGIPKRHTCTGRKSWFNQKSVKIWRNEVFERDNYICQECGTRGGTLNAHHIRYWATHPYLRFDIDNGITLCEECHKLVHRGG